MKEKILKIILGNILKNMNNPTNKRKGFSNVWDIRSFTTYRRENKYFPDFGNRKINYYGKNYFFRN